MRGNRHGFQNFGGRKTGQMLPVDPSDMNHLRYIADQLQLHGVLTVSAFDGARNNLGDVIRHGLRKHKLIYEYEHLGAGVKCIAMTPRGRAFLKHQKPEI